MDSEFIEKSYMTEGKHRYWPYINAIGFAMVFELFFLVVLYKAFQVPITHDEAYTALIYPKYSYWQLMMYPSSYTNNHILNTLLVKLLISMFGLEQWLVRLPNILAFLVYTLAVFRITRSVTRRDSPLFLLGAVLFLCSSYFLDFFSLCRGYGLSNSFCALSISFLLTGAKQGKTRDLWLAFLFGLLASYANFSSLIFWVSVTAMVFFYLFWSFRDSIRKLALHLALLAVSCIGYGLLILSPILKMQQDNMFRFFSAANFYSDTMLNLAHHIRTGDFSITWADHLIAVLLIGAVLTNVLYILFRFMKAHRDPEWFRQPAFITGMAVLLTVLVNVLQHILLKTPYLSGRIGLFYFPLFISALVAFLGTFMPLKRQAIAGMASILVSCGLLVNLGGTLSLRSVQEWWFDANTFTVLDLLNTVEKDHVVRLHTDWTYYPSFAFYKKTGRMPNIILEEYNEQLDSNSKADYYYAYSYNYNALKSRFEPFWEAGNTPMLMKATRHLDLTAGELEHQDIEQVSIYKSFIRKNPGWVHVIAQKAVARRITFDEMLTRDAMYMVAVQTNKRYHQ